MLFIRPERDPAYRLFEYYVYYHGRYLGMFIITDSEMERYNWNVDHLIESRFKDVIENVEGFSCQERVKLMTVWKRVRHYEWLHNHLKTWRSGSPPEAPWWVRQAEKLVERYRSESRDS